MRFRHRVLSPEEVRGPSVLRSDPKVLIGGCFPLQEPDVIVTRTNVKGKVLIRIPRDPINLHFIIVTTLDTKQLTMCDALRVSCKKSESVRNKCYMTLHPQTKISLLCLQIFYSVLSEGGGSGSGLDGRSPSVTNVRKT